MRCSRCGRTAEATDKFCAECGMFLRDAFIDHRLLQALVYEREDFYTKTFNPPLGGEALGAG